jgi:hypothetical protein
MPLEDVCVHTCTPLRITQQEESGEWIEGEWIITQPGVTEESRATPFDGCLFLPRGEEATGGGVAVILGREVLVPTLLYLPEDHDGDAVALDREDRVGVVAAELNEARGYALDFEEMYFVNGSPQPFGKPGEPVIGLQAILQKVED